MILSSDVYKNGETILHKDIQKQGYLFKWDDSICFNSDVLSEEVSLFVCISYSCSVCVCVCYNYYRQFLL